METYTFLRQLADSWVLLFLFRLFRLFRATSQTKAFLADYQALPWDSWTGARWYIVFALFYHLPLVAGSILL